MKICAQEYTQEVINVHLHVYASCACLCAEIFKKIYLIAMICTGMEGERGERGGGFLNSDAMNNNSLLTSNY